MSSDLYTPSGAETREPLTSEQWARVLEGRPMRYVVTEEQKKWAGSLAKRCLSCGNCGKAYGDPRRAWCPTVRMQVADTFAVLCPHWVHA